MAKLYVVVVLDKEQAFFETGTSGGGLICRLMQCTQCSFVSHTWVVFFVNCMQGCKLALNVSANQVLFFLEGNFWEPDYLGNLNGTAITV